MLHLLARTEGIGSGALFSIFPQFLFPHDSGQGAIGNLMPPALKDLSYPHNIPLRFSEGFTDKWDDFLMVRLPARFLPLSPDNPSHGIAGEFEDLGYFSQIGAPFAQTQDGQPRLFGNHYHTSLSLFRVL